MTKKEPIPPRDSWITLKPKQSIEVTPEVAADWDRQKTALRQIRGNILAYSLDIEFAVDVAIREVLFSVENNVNGTFSENIEKNKGIFDSTISKSGALTFNNKIKILRNLLLENSIFGEDDRKLLFKLLNKVKSIRNKFAHTTLAFEPKANTERTQLTPYIVEGGIRVYMDNNYFDKLNQLYAECLVRVENVTRAIQKTPLEPLPKVALVKDSVGERES